MKNGLVTFWVVLALFLFAGCGAGDETPKPQQEIQDNKLAAKADTDKSLIVTGESITFSADEGGSKYEWFNENGKLLSSEKSFNRAFYSAGTYTTTLKVTDEGGEVTSSAVTVKVDRNNTPVVPDPANKPPVAKASISEYEICVGNGVRFYGDQSFDPDGNIVAYSWRDMDGIEISTEAVFSRGFPYAATYHKTLTVTDNKGATHSMTVDLVVKVCNTPPVGNNDTAETDAGVSVNIPVLTNDTDIDGDTLSIMTNPTAPANGTAVINADGVTIDYMPNLGFDGTDTFTYIPYDGTVNGNAATVTVNVIKTCKPLPRTGQTSSYYEGDDADLKKGAPRVFDRNDSTNIVTDFATGLLWEDTLNDDDRTWNEAKTYCANLGEGWRLPLQEELIHLVDRESQYPSIYHPPFQDTFSDYYWSSQKNAFNPSEIWGVSFGQGDQWTVDAGDYWAKIRCVKGESITHEFERDNDKDIVVDKKTCLIWQDDSNVSDDEDGFKTWEGALDYCNNLNHAGYNSGWRLPNYNELISIVDRSRAIEPVANIVFEHTSDWAAYWTSTTFKNETDTNQAFYIEFADGADGVEQKVEDWFLVRCVRDTGGL